jgi:hypothetical protein
VILLISSSCMARITSVNHWRPAHVIFLKRAAAFSGNMPECPSKIPNSVLFIRATPSYVALVSTSLFAILVKNLAFTWIEFSNSSFIIWKMKVIVELLLAAVTLNMYLIITQQHFFFQYGV